MFKTWNPVVYMKEENNFAFIDSQNVNLGVQQLGWRVDFVRLRVYLHEHYRVSEAFLFLGYVPEYQKLYVSLRTAGYHLIFKPIVRNREGAIKGNCDAELVLHTMINFNMFSRAVIITGDGDMACVVEYLKHEGKLRVLLVPNLFRYSGLLKRAAGERLYGMNALERFLSVKQKHPDAS